MDGKRVFFTLCSAALLVLCSLMFSWPKTPALPNVLHFWIHDDGQRLTTTHDGMYETASFPSNAVHDVQPTGLSVASDHKEPADKFKPAKFESRGIVTDDALLYKWFRKQGIKFTKGVSLRRDQPETELERNLLAMPPLTDNGSLPDTTKSKVTILLRRETYRVGDSIQVRVDLYDKLGRSRTTDGDEVRMWLKSQRNSIVADVTDMRNGSYLGETVLQWPGRTKVQVSLTYPREFYRVLVLLRHTVHSMRWVTAVFRDGRGAKETTVCLPSFPVPGFAGVCNLTSRNSDIPWYCGHPTHPSLNCSHWALTGNMAYTPLGFSVTPAERSMVRQIDRRPFTRLIPNKEVITVESDPRQSSGLPLPPCHSVPPRDTWDAPSPKGWFEQRSWRASTCSLPELTSQYAQKCMRNTTLVLMGDSNMHLFYLLIKKRLGLKCADSDEVVYNTPQQCKFSQLNASLHWVRHAMPYNVGGHAKLESTLQPRVLDHLHVHPTRRNNLVVVIHYYVHLSFYPLAPYRDRVRGTRQAVERLLKRVPSAKIFIRGPHVIYDGKQNHAAFGDNFGAAYTKIWKEEFRAISDKVWFLDYWDLTIASENMTSHPPDLTVYEMIKVLFGYFCGV